MSDNQLSETPTQPIPVVVPEKKRSFDPRILFILLILIGIVGGFFSITRQSQEAPLPTPFDTPTPTPKSKTVIPIATESAYSGLVKNVGTLSESLQSLQVTDTTISPPTIELPLGFPNQ